MPQPIVCKTPTKGWLNLAYARQVQFCKIYVNPSKEQRVCVITWSNGHKEGFFDLDAQVIAQTWKIYTKI
ncbi:MAG: hypothetical protein C4323_01015 [Mastigocladus sp. ERB_26_2]